MRFALAVVLIGVCQCGGQSPNGAPQAIHDAGQDGTLPPTDADDDRTAIVADAARSEGSDEGSDDGSLDAPERVPDGSGASDDSPAEGDGASPAEAGNAGCATNKPCTNPLNGQAGVCVPATGLCEPCSISGGDTGCQAAYGSQYLCVGLACAVASCLSSDDCARGSSTTGEMCVSQQCVPCTSDAQCQADTTYRSAFPVGELYVRTVCDTTAGRCVGADCVQPHTLCNAPPNTNGTGGDICCGDPGTGMNSPQCTPGSCCDDGDCQETELCESGACVPGACAQNGGGTVYVDPVRGRDSSSASGAAQCAYRSITYALKVSSLPVVVLSGSGSPVLSAATGEKFPITLQAGASISSDTQDVTRAPVLRVDPGAVGILAPASGITLAYITLDGQDNQADRGIVFGGSASAGSSNLQSVIVRGMLHAGIVTTDPNPLHFNNVSCLQNGTATVPGSGLVASATAVVDLDDNGPTGGSAFDGNSQYGISVTQSASLTVGFTNSDAEANDNGAADVWISQTPSKVSMSDVIQIQGFHATGGPVGIAITAGSFVVVRNSVIVPHTQASVSISSFSAGAVKDSDLSSIDLGDPSGGGYGFNTLGGSGSTGTGICLAVAAGPSVLLAAGNTFATADCSNPAGGTLTRSSTCPAGVDLGGVGTTGGDVDVTACQ